MPPDVTASSLRGHLVLHFTGELDVAARAVFDAARRLLDRGGNFPSVLDLTGVGFLDCAGAREIDVLLRDVSPEPVVVCPPGGTRHLLELTGLCDVHTVEPTLLHATSPRFRASPRARRAPGQTG